MNATAHVAQLMKSKLEDSLQRIADLAISDIQKCFTNQKRFYLLGYSFGSLIAVKIASMLEKRGQVGHVILIDGSPAYLKRLAQGLTKTKTTDDDNLLIMVMFRHLCSSDLSEAFMARLSECTDWPMKVDLVVEFLSDEVVATYSREYLHDIIVAILNRLKVVISLNVTDDDVSGVIGSKLKSSITLVRPTQASFTDIIEDYGLNQYSEHAIDIKYVEGNHLTVLDNPELTNIINNVTSTTEGISS